MSDTEVENLRHRVAAAEAKLVQWQAGEAADRLARDAARIGAEIAGLVKGGDPFAAAVRATRMPMVISDPRLPDNPIVFVNDAFCRLCGYPREEILGRNCRFLQGPGTAPDTVATIRAGIDAAQSVNIDILNYRKTGEAFWSRLLMAPVRDAEGQLAYFFASQVDVTLERERSPAPESLTMPLSWPKSPTGSRSRRTMRRAFGSRPTRAASACGITTCRPEPSRVRPSARRPSVEAAVRV